MNRLALALLLLAASAPNAAAQTGSARVVDVSATGPAAAVPAGTTFQATITLQVQGGYHVNAQKPSEDYLIGTSLKLSPPSGITVSKVDYPKARFVKFEFSETPLAVYEGSVRIVATLKAGATLAPGQMSVPGKVTFQACNDQSCLPPSTVDVTFSVDVGAAAPKATLTLTGAPPKALVTIDGKSVGRADESGRFVAKDLEPGRKRVRVEQEGFEAWEQAVSVDADKPQIVPVSLESTAAAPTPAETPAPAPTPEPTPTPAPTPAPVAATQPPTESSSMPVWVALGVGAVAVGATGIYFATRARA